MKISFTIPLEVKTKKNHSRAIHRNGRMIVLPSKQYVEFENKALKYCPKLGIDYPVNLQAVFYMGSRRRIDLNNALQFTDLLTKAGTIQDDNFHIIYSFDGSHIDYDKQNPRIEVTITKVEDTPLKKCTPQEVK